MKISAVKKQLLTEKLNLLRLRNEKLRNWLEDPKVHMYA
jgi:regulator of replication initiation timing